MYPTAAVLAQIDVSVGGDPAGTLGSGAGSAFLTTLVVGAVLVAIAPAYVEARMADALEDPVGNLVYGVAALLVLAVLIVALVLSIVGILAVIPLFVAAYAVWAVGSTVGFLAIADRLIDRDGEWALALVVAAGLNGALVLTGVGGLGSLVVGAMGFGAVLSDWLE